SRRRRGPQGGGSRRPLGRGGHRGQPADAVPRHHPRGARRRRPRHPPGRGMTAHRTRGGQDADDLDVEEALALVKDDPGPAARAPGRRAHATAWAEARALAERAGRPGRAGRRAPVSVPLDTALGLTLAAPLAALTDLPSFDTSAMDGWAVAGPGPWQVRDEGVLAGHAAHAPLTDGEAVRIGTGARVRADTTEVLRSEHGRHDAKGRLHIDADHGPLTLAHGQDIRPRGQECRSGDQLLAVGTP